MCLDSGERLTIKRAVQGLWMNEKYYQSWKDVPIPENIHKIVLDTGISAPVIFLEQKIETVQ